MKKKTRARAAKDNLILFPGCHVADYCLPAGIDERGLSLLYVDDHNLSSLGIGPGMVIVARRLDDETPPDKSLCILRINRELYLKRVRRARRGYYISDDSGEKPFSADEVTIEAVALHACSCDLLGSSCEPVTLGDCPCPSDFSDPWKELASGWERFIAAEGIGQ